MATSIATTTTILLLTALVHGEETSERHRQRRARARLRMDDRRRRARRITRRALQHPSMSAFSTLFGSGCDQSLITTCGLDHRAFRLLLNRFEPVYHRYTPYSPDGRIVRMRLSAGRGRPRSMTASHCLGMALTWIRSRGSEHMLSLVFSVTGSVCSLFLRFARRILIRILCSDPRALRLPTDAEVEEFQGVFETKHPNLRDVYCVADGLKLMLEQCADVTIQNRYYKRVDPMTIM